MDNNLATRSLYRILANNILHAHESYRHGKKNDHRFKKIGDTTVTCTFSSYTKYNPYLCTRTFSMLSKTVIISKHFISVHDTGLVK